MYLCSAWIHILSARGTFESAPLDIDLSCHTEFLMQLYTSYYYAYISCYYVPHTVQTSSCCRTTVERHRAAAEYCPSQLDPGSYYQNVALRSWCSCVCVYACVCVCVCVREREREHRIKLFNLLVMSRLCTVSCLMQTSFNPYSTSSLTENEVRHFPYLSS